MNQSLPFMSNSTVTPVDDLGSGAGPESIASTWVTSLSCLICIGIFLGLASIDDVNSWDKLAQFGYLPANSIWRGQYWGLVTSVFVHMALWHVAFNVYWLWSLGSRLERSIGSIPFLTFFLASAFVSSAFQMAVSDTTGIGASGVVYSIFGFMWLTRERYCLFAEVLAPQTILIFAVWLFVCLATTVAKVWEVGNAAHFSGLIFGCCVAKAFVLRSHRPVAMSTLGFLLASSIVFCFWCPWSITWLGTRAYSAHVAGRYQDAIENYTQIIQLAPQNAWAFQNRSYAYQALGEEQKAKNDIQMARKFDPTIEISE